MRTIQLREKVGDDGVLHLAVPLQSGAGEVEVIIVVQPVAPTAPEEGKNGFATKIVDGERFRLEEGEWVHDSWPVGFFRETYGSLAHDPIERPEELPFEEREPVE